MRIGGAGRVRTNRHFSASNLCQQGIGSQPTMQVRVMDQEGAGMCAKLKVGSALRLRTTDGANRFHPDLEKRARSAAADADHRCIQTQVGFAAAVAIGVLIMSFGTSASAADLAGIPPPPPVVAPVSPWAGFYIGAHIGGVTSHETVDGFGSIDTGGVIAGLQGGYNWQFAPAWLIGIEEEISVTSAGGTKLGFESSPNWYDTVDARLGYILPWDGWMVYGKAGVAMMEVDYAGVIADNQTRVGWNVGVGVEYLIAPQWSMKAEYNFLDFGKGNAPGTLNGVDTQVNQFKVGLNYHFAP
jgi:outer membrane immunogenic protein